MKYKELTGICRTAIKEDYCLGCQKLELEEFTGVEKCGDIDTPIERINKVLGMQLKIEIK